MVRLQHERQAQELSISKLSRLADLNPSTISWAEQRGFRLYDAQLAKLAKALEYEGNPSELLEECDEG